MKINADSIKQFFIVHVEKIGFGLALTLVALFIYKGYSIQGYKRKPVDLASAAQAATTKMNTDSWADKLAAEPIDPERAFSKEVKDSNLQIEAVAYYGSTPWEPRAFQPIAKRKDPELLPPIDLEVDVTFGAVAVPAKGATDLIAALDDAPPPEPEETQRKRSSSSRRGRGSSRGGDESGGSGMDPGGYGAGGAAGMGDESDFGGKGDGPGMPGMPGGIGGAGGMGGPGGMGGGSAMGGSSRRRMQAPDWWQRFGANSGGSSVIGKGYYIVGIKALVPYQAQFDEYERVLGESIGYDPKQRDLPNYLSFAVERAEVGDDPAAPLAWERLSSAAAAIREARNWAGAGRDVCSPTYLMPGSLTMSIPPLMMRDADHLGAHSKIPRLNHVAKEEDGDAEKAEEEPDDDRGDIDIPDELPRPGAGGGYAMGGDGYGGADGGYGEDGGGLSFGSGGGSAGISGPPGMGDDGGMGGMGGYGMGSSVSPKNVTEYKLVRFFDLTARPGKKYRYRIQLLMEDPNHPKLGDLNERMLDTSVLTRLAELAKSETESRRLYYRRTVWSEPSEVVEMPITQRLFAGPAKLVSRTAAYPTPTGGKVPLRDVTAKVSSVIWDNKYATDVSYNVDAVPGTTLNKKGEFQVIHPVTMDLKQVKDYPYRGDSIVVDIRGGEQVGDRDDPQVAPTQFAAVDAFGNLIVRDEVADIEDFRIFAFVEDKPQTRAGGMGGMGGGDAPGMPGMPGVPGGGMDFGGGADMGGYGSGGMGDSEGGGRGRGRRGRGGDGGY